MAAFAFKVHKWPWKEYIQTGRREIAETLDPESVEPRLDRPELAAGQMDADGRRYVRGNRRDGNPYRRSSAFIGGSSDARVPLVRRHVVRKNETLYAIASRFYGAGERWPEIARANDIRKPSDLRVGRAIVVPYDTVAFEDRTDGMWVPDLSLRFAVAASEDGKHAGEATR